jgi:hypothetical protein
MEIEKKATAYLQKATKEFCDELAHLQKGKSPLLLANKTLFTNNYLDLPESIPSLSLLSLHIDDSLSLWKNINDSSPEKNNPPHLKALKDFLTRILASLDVMNTGPFYQAIFVKTCEVERKKAADESKQKVVSAAVDVNRFTETITPQEYPTLHSKKICLHTDKDI